ncbi:MAG: glycosyltransferase family 4 protein [Patescibacteria group bacterium]|jgi:glycosyltransferase involved in cell wall biosynthesis
MKRVNIVVSTYPPYGGGMGNVAASQARALSQEGIQVNVYTSAPKPESVEGGAVKVIYVKTLFRYGNAAIIPNFPDLTTGAEIVILNYPFFGGAQGYARRGVAANQKLVLFYHMDNVGVGWKKLLFKLYHRRYLKPLLDHAHLILVSSVDYAEHSLLAQYLPSIGGRLRELPLSVNTALFSPGPKPDHLLAEYGFTKDTPVALFVGGLDGAHYFKGISVLLKSWQEVVREVPNAKLLLVGDGDRRVRYEAEAKHLRIADSVGFLGSVSGDMLPEHYRLADVVVLPSIDASEAFGLVLLEAMASARATVASHLPGLRRVVRDGETGQLVEPKSVEALSAALIHLLSRPAVAKRYGERGRIIVEEEYSEPVVRKKLLELLGLVL